MSWNDTSIISPPKDRIIEVTWGGAWTYQDYYRAPEARYMPNTTRRQWQFKGAVALVIWRGAGELGSPYENGGWYDMSRDSILTIDFPFWREYDNPIAGREGMLTDVVPPHSISESFEGDARLRLYASIEANIQKNIDMSKSHIDKDIKRGVTPLPSVERALRIYTEKLEKAMEERKNAYDPYDIPDGVDGSPYSG